MSGSHAERVRRGLSAFGWDSRVSCVSAWYLMNVAETVERFWRALEVLDLDATPRSVARRLRLAGSTAFVTPGVRFEVRGDSAIGARRHATIDSSSGLADRDDHPRLRPDPATDTIAVTCGQR